MRISSALMSSFREEVGDTPKRAEEFRILNKFSCFVLAILTADFFLDCGTGFYRNLFLMKFNILEPTFQQNKFYVINIVLIRNLFL